MNEVEFIQRTLASFEGDTPLSGDLKRVWIRGLRAHLNTPGLSLDKAMDLCDRGQDSIATKHKRWQRNAWVRNHYQAHHAPQSRYAASHDIADNLVLLAINHDDPHIDDSYRELFDLLESAGIELPSQRTIYRLLLNS